MLLVLVAVLSLLPSPALAQAPIGEAAGGEAGGTPVCIATPAACLGAPIPIPGGTAGATPGRGECRGGRIVTPEAGAQSDGIPYCPDTDADGVADPPPSPAEIVASCPTPPLAVLRLSPQHGGITGVDTWYWHGGPATASTSTSIRGHAVSCRLDAIEFTLDTGDVHAREFGTERVRSADGPGQDGPDTDLRHRYERVGTFAVTLDITWRRTTSPPTGPATVQGTGDARSYEVREVRSGMTPTSG